jgi:hypothetical protein
MKNQAKKQTKNSQKQFLQQIEQQQDLLRILLENLQSSQTVKSKEIFVKEPFYMKNGGEQMPMITDGAERNVPVSLRVVKRIRNKVITLERYRSRMQDYINVRSIVKREGVDTLGLREIENKNFTTNEEGVKIIFELLISL